MLFWVDSLAKGMHSCTALLLYCTAFFGEVVVLGGTEGGLYCLERETLCVEGGAGRCDRLAASIFRRGRV